MTPDRAAAILNEILEKAKQGDVESMRRIGLYFMAAQCEAQNLDEAEKWLTKAAELGDIDAQCGLGCLYVKYLGNLEEEVKAEFKNPLDRLAALNMLGSHYLSEARKWLIEAAKEGHEGAIDMLSELPRK